MTVEPITPGEALRDIILEHNGLTQDQLAEALQVSRLTVSQLVNGRRGVSAEMSLRLSRVLSTTAEFWLNLQRAVDLYEAQNRLGDDLLTLKVLRKADRTVGQAAAKRADKGAQLRRRRVS